MLIDLITTYWSFIQPDIRIDIIFVQHLITFLEQGFANVRHRRLFIYFTHSPIDRIHHGHSIGILLAVRWQKLPNEKRKCYMNSYFFFYLWMRQFFWKIFFFLLLYLSYFFSSFLPVFGNLRSTHLVLTSTLNNPS